MKDAIIKLEGLSKRYGTIHAVQELDLHIQKGEIFGLLGPNGAGKTTTILMLLGLTEPSSGHATIAGYDATSNPIAVKKNVGYLPDNIGFYDNMTALENLMYIGRLNGISSQELEDRAREMMNTVGLGDAIHKKTAAYSRGMKQRLGLADVLIKQPGIIILDEPTLGIDPSGVKEFLQLIYKLSREQKLTVLLSSHHLNQVQQVCDRVGIFVDGKLLAEGNIDELSKNVFKHAPYVTQLFLKEPIALPWNDEPELLQLKAVQKITVKGNHIDISCEQDVTPTIVRFFVKKGYDITGVRKVEYGLEDIYQRYFETNDEKKTKKA